MLIWSDERVLHDAIGTRYEEVFPHKDFWVPPRVPSQTGGNRGRLATPETQLSLPAQRT